MKPITLLLTMLLCTFFNHGTNAQAFIKSPEELYSTKKVKLIDATEVADFRGYHAIIRKGENYAIIDQYGDFAVPFGTYKFNTFQGYKIDEDRCGFYNGMCVVRDPVTEKYGYINRHFKLVVPCTLTDAEPFAQDGYGWAKQLNAKGIEEQLFIDTNGVKYRIKDQSLYNHKVLNAYPAPALNGAKTFYSKNGKPLFTTKRRYKGTFSEGLIRVDTTMQMVGDRTGFMDLKGRLVIPYKLKGRVSDFHHGLALYEPQTGSDYRYVYLNKKGDAVIQLRSTSEFKELDFGNCDFDGEYALGASLGKAILLDTTGKTVDVASLIENTNPTFTNKFKSFKIEPSSIRKQGYAIKFRATMEYDVQEEITTGGFNGGRKVKNTVTKSITGEGVANCEGQINVAPLYSTANFTSSGITKVIYPAQDNGRRVNITGYTYRNSREFTFFNLITTIRSDTPNR